MISPGMIAVGQPNLRTLIRQGGQSVVEFAVLVPVLLLMLLGVLDLGRGFFAYVTVANAAREAARYTSMHPSVSQDFVRQKVAAEMGGTLDLGSDSNLLSVVRSSIDITDTITVTVRYSFTTVFLGPVSNLVANFWGGPSIPNPILVDAHAVIPISPGNLQADAAAATASAIAAATGTALGIPSWTATRSPTITPTPSVAWISLSSSVAYSGESLTIRGCNFHNNRTVTIYWDGAPSWSSLTDNNGCFGPSSFAVPVSTSGSNHTVSASTSSGAETRTAVASPQLQVIATPTATNTPTRTGTATFTSTRTATGTGTATATSTPIPIVLNRMEEDDVFVSGTAGPGVTIEVRDMTADGRPVIGTGTSLGDGTFNIAVSPELELGHTILVSSSNGAATSGQVVNKNPTATPSPSATGSPTMTPTHTSTPTPTPPTPVACWGTSIGGTIYGPDASRSGNATVNLIMDGQIVNSSVTGSSGNFSFSSDYGGTPLQGNRSYSIEAVKGGFTTNWASVYLPCGQAVSNVNITLSGSTPTAIATTTAPSPPVLSGMCTNVGANYFNALSWTAVSGAVNYYVFKYNTSSSAWEWIVTTSSTSVDVSANSSSINRYYVTAVNANYVQSYLSNIAMVVCGNTPTPTITPTVTPSPTLTPTPFPDLIPHTITTEPASGSIQTGQPVTVTVVLYNQGALIVNTLFWVDLYVDPSPAPPTGYQAGASWQAVSSVGALSYVTLTFFTSFSTEDSHLLYSQVDTYGDVSESNEANNVSNPYVVWVVAASTATPAATPAITATETSTPAQSPTSTATPTSTPQPGSISGDTYIYANGAWSLQGRVAVTVYGGADIIASTISDAEGHYQVAGVPPGTYSVSGEAEVNSQTYDDTRPGVTVTAGTNTPEIDLFLFPT